MEKNINPKLCYGKGVPVNPGDRLVISNPIEGNKRLHWSETTLSNIRQTGVKRIILKCTTCGRKMKASVDICHDACCIIFSMPPHKPKAWWKKKTKKNHDRRVICTKR